MVIFDAVHLGAFVAVARRDVDLAADDGLDTLLLRFFIKIDDAIHRAVIRDCDGLHPLRLRRRDEVGDAACAVEQAELRMHMQMGERDGRFRGRRRCCFFDIRNGNHLISKSPFYYTRKIRDTEGKPLSVPRMVKVIETAIYFLSTVAISASACRVPCVSA